MLTLSAVVTVAGAVGLMSPPPPLAGPRVEVTQPAPSLVAYDFAGRLRRPEVPAEVAAVALLELDEPARAAVDGLLAERAAALDRFVVQNLDLLTKFGVAAATGDKLDQIGLAQQAYAKLGALRARGTLQGAIGAALPPGARERFDAVLDEYWRAVVAEGQREVKEDGTPKTGFEAVVEERLKSLGREIELAFERQRRSGDLYYHFLTDGLELRPEQAARVRQAVADVVERHDVESDTRAQALLGASILAYLDADQAAAFIERVNRLSP